MKIIIFVLSILGLSLAYNQYELSSTANRLFNQIEVNQQILKGQTDKNGKSIERIENRADIAVSHLSKVNLVKLDKALKSAKIYDYDSLVESYYGGFNAYKQVSGIEGNRFEDCQFWAKVGVTGALEIQDCKKDIWFENN
jgi:hypothetical protein